MSATEIVAGKLAADAGVNGTETVQFAPAARVVPQVVVWAKSVGLVPAIAMLVMFNVALPLLVRVVLCAARVVPDVAEKVSVAGLNVTAGAGRAVPVPERAEVWVVGVALSVTVSVAA